MMKKLFLVFIVMGVSLICFHAEGRNRTTVKKKSGAITKKTLPSTRKKISAVSLQKAMAGYDGQWFAGGYLGDWIGAQGGRWLTNNWVGQTGLGYDFSSGAFGVALDGQYYFKDNLLIDVREGKLYFYPNVGLKVGFSSPIQVRIRTLAGAAYFFPEHPVSLHLELGPSWRVTQGFGIGLAGGVVVRYHF